LNVLQALVKKGNTVIVIEHNMDVVKTADHVIDLGPEGGQRGGEIVFTGTPEALAETDTHTARYVREELERAREILDDDGDEAVDLDAMADDEDDADGDAAEDDTEDGADVEEEVTA